MWRDVAKLSEIAPGGLKSVGVNGTEIVLCNDGGKIYAIDRRCGHMNAPLEMGTLAGTIVTCPMHHAQFDVITGKVLSGPVPASLGDEAIPKRIGQYMQYVGMLMSHIKTCDLKSYPVSVEGGSIKVEV
jgi:nitrite reductase/ring-hydroxylating ferredoxin subunit